MITVTIDDKEVKVPAGTTVLVAARSVGIDIPTLCHDDRLEPTGACRLCLVEEIGAARLLAACAAPVHEGMQIRTSSPAILSTRATTLTMLASTYPAEIGPAPPTAFSRLIEQAGAVPGGEAEVSSIDDSHPYIHVEMDRCIDCFRCIRICDEVQGQNVWHLRHRGSDTEIQPDGPSLLDSPCVGCGACVDTCPSGALTDCRRVGDTVAAWTRTVCPYCGVGCELEYGAQDGRLVAARPVLEAPVNRGHACVKGRYAFEFVHAPDRISTPLIRDGAAWKAAAWGDAIDAVAGRLQQIIARHGPDAVGILGSARATNEENYLTQKLARAVIGTNNVDCCARVCHAPSAAALKTMLGAGAATNSFDDIERARTLLVCGANPTENHPVIGARLRQAARRGARLIVIDPRRIELAAEQGALHLAVRPGTNVPLLNAMAHTIVTDGLLDRSFIERHVDGLDGLRDLVSSWTPERAAVICGVSADEIRRAARIYAGNGPAMIVHGLGVTEHVQGTDGVSALVNLALLTGNVGRPGTGVNPLRGQNNVQGAAQMGCDPTTLAGGVPIEEGRGRFESVWQCTLPRSRGLKVLEMIDAAEAGRLKALVVIGYDILLSNPNVTRTRRALQSLDLLVVLDLFLTQTASLAHVFLPVVSSFEKDGTFMNAERRVQRVRKVIDPIGQSRSDADVICALAAAMGHASEFTYAGPQQIWDEIRTLWPACQGMTYERLDRRGLQWPCPAEDHPGTATLYTQGFGGSRVQLRRIEFRPTVELTSAEYPYVLTTGRTLYQFNAATMTDRTPNHDLRPADTLDVPPSAATELHVVTGDAVSVTSRYGSVVLPVRVTDALAPGQLFATFHRSHPLVNSLTSDLRDPVGTPEYKITAVRLEPVTRVVQ